MAEYKFDKRNNRPVLLEINPRFWGSIQLAISAGVNFPVLYHKTALGYEVVPKLDFKLARSVAGYCPAICCIFFQIPIVLTLSQVFSNFLAKICIMILFR